MGRAKRDTDLLVSGGNGKGRELYPAPTRRLAIVGSHSATRDNAPWDDPSFEIWLFNEAAQKPSIYKRWDGLLQIHNEKVYTSLTNWVNKDHWAWLQQDHGDRRIFMQDVDPRVPNSVRYPLEEVLALIKPLHYLRSSPAEALGLAIYLGYKEIWLYGSELSSGTEYAYQATNYAFWIGFAKGYGVDLHLECWQSEFNQPIYGYEGEMQIPREYFAARAVEFAKDEARHEETVRKLKSEMEKDLMFSKYQKAADVIYDIEVALQNWGEARGRRTEAERYSLREDMISRQEYERTAGYALKDGTKMQTDMATFDGKCEYVWNVWRQTGKVEALNQLRTFLKERNDAAMQTGLQLGILRENQEYQTEYDRLVQALGGQRAVHHLQPEAVGA